MTESNAITQCRLRLTRLENAVSALSKSGNSKEAHLAWADIISSLGTIYSKLEQGSKISGEAMAWFGRVKNERKTDPLLSYAHHARNSEEHGVEWVVSQRGRGIGVRQMSGGSFMAERQPDGSYATMFFGDLRNPPPIIEHLPPSLQLLPVHDSRYGDTFNPPTHHLGEPIGDDTAIAVAPLLLDYAKKLIEAAVHFGV
jgi:hypothetical protein